MVVIANNAVEKDALSHASHCERWPEKDSQMKKVCIFLLFTMLAATISVAAEEVDLFILAGQSNAQGWKGDATHYPVDSYNLDESIRFYWVTPRHSSSGSEWTTLKAQGGRFKNGHFGLEVTFARSLKQAGHNPAIFKYSLGSTSIARNWRGPGDGEMYDQMTEEFDKAVALLRKEGHTVKIRGFVWIQGESDAQTPAMAEAYKGMLKKLIDDLRKKVTKNPELPVILGVDEQHPWVKKNHQVVQAQQELAEADKSVIFTSMIGLEKADGTHLTPKGLEEHGKRIYTAYDKMASGQKAVPRDGLWPCVNGDVKARNE